VHVEQEKRYLFGGDAAVALREMPLEMRQLLREELLSPELLAALIECAARLQIHMKHTEDLIAHMQAHKAIARATGEQA
jgi:hypothetical protein